MPFDAAIIGRRGPTVDRPSGCTRTAAMPATATPKGCSTAAVPLLHWPPCSQRARIAS